MPSAASPGPDELPAFADEDGADCWFDEPIAGERRAWAVPSGHGTYRELELELLDPDDEDELMFLVEALHACDDPPGSRHLAESGGSVDPQLHVSMHQAVARQILNDEPPETWQTVQRLAGQGYDWHTIMHMIAELVTHDVWGTLAENRKYDPADYARRLSQLPSADWPAPGDGPS